MGVFPLPFQDIGGPPLVTQWPPQYSQYSCLPPPQCELYHWVDLLDRFDGILAEAGRPVENMSWMLACDRPEREQLKALLLALLNFTALLIEYSFSRHLYSSIEVLGRGGNPKNTFRGVLRDGICYLMRVVWCHTAPDDAAGLLGHASGVGGAQPPLRLQQTFQLYHPVGVRQTKPPPLPPSAPG